jgi:hypothetical protein
MRQPNGEILLKPGASKEEHEAFRLYVWSIWDELAKKRALKAAQMRRYRAKKARK